MTRASRYSTEIYDYSGSAVSSAGDINNDGIDDLVIGAASSNPNGLNSAGEAYVVFGRETSFPAQSELSSLATGDGSNGFVVVFGRTSGFPVVFELSTLVNGDGSTGFELRGIDAGDTARHVRSAGDINRDGLGDIIISAPMADPGGRNEAGESYIVFGRTEPFAPIFELSDLVNGNGDSGFVINGISTGDFIVNGGHADVNGDGFDDLLLGSNRAPFLSSSSEIGESYVVYGRDSEFPATIELSSLLIDGGGDGSEGFVLRGIDLGDRAGNVKAGGDIDNDGIDDLIIGASRADPGNRDSAGETYVVYGRAPITDSDSDGLSDDNDNCLLVANSDQRDTDGDGHGNLCDADLNQDCGVNMLDFNLLVDQFFTTSADPDFNGDGYINFLDFSLFKSMFIQPVGPSASPSLCD